MPKKFIWTIDIVLSVRDFIGLQSIKSLMLILFFLAFTKCSVNLKTFPQLIDHQNPDLGTFDQYYYEVDDYFDPEKGTVILKLGAESPSLEPSGVNDWMKDLAKRFHSKVITIQHRFFGNSQPFDNTKTESLKYLAVDQALEDYSYFYDYYVKVLYPEEKIHPWLIVGGSYPGLLSALARKRYPDKFTAAYSSAGVVMASSDLTEFDLQDAISMGQECAAVSRDVRRKIDEMYVSDKEYLYQMMGWPEDFDEFNVMYVTGELFTLSLQYAHLDKLCGPLVDAHKKGDDLLMAFSKYAKNFFYPTFGDPAAYSTSYMKDTTATNKSASRCWLWMTCNELGYWQYSPGRVGIRSQKLNSKEPFLKQCKDVFGIDMDPDTDGFNKKNGGLKQDSTNVIFTTGSQDPWNCACVTEENVMNNNWAHTIIGKEIGHHVDFNSPREDDPIDLKRTRAHIINLLDQWLAVKNQ